MKNKAKDILLKILGIIDYRKDRSLFADKFIDLIFRQAFLKVVKNLPFDKKKQLDERLKNKNLDDSLKILLEYVAKEDFEKAVERISLEMFIDYIQQIMPALSPERKNKLTAYLNKLQNQ